MRQNKTKTETKENTEKEMVVVDPSNENNQDIGFSGEWINIRKSTVITLNDYLVVQHNDGPIQLKVNITADFNTIPKEYHEIFLNVLSARYQGRVNFGDNPFSNCKPVQKRKWYQFWKSKYFVGP
jgi:hypothetical protein